MLRKHKAFFTIILVLSILISNFATVFADDNQDKKGSANSATSSSKESASDSKKESEASHAKDKKAAEKKDAEEPSANEDPYILVMDPSRNKGEKASFANYLAEVQEEHEIEFRSEALPKNGKGSSVDKLNPFDVWCLDNDTAEKLIKDNKVVSLEEIWTEYLDFADRMNKSLFHTSKNGNQYAIPVTGYWIALYYNCAVLADSGIEYINTDMSWDEFEAICDQVYYSGFVPIAVALQDKPDYWWDYTLMNYQGIENHTVLDYERMNSIERQLQQVMADLKDMYDYYYFSDDAFSIGWKDGYTQFLNGEAAFFLDGSWRLKNFSDDLDEEELNNFGVTYLPGYANRASTDLIGQFNNGFYISRKAWEDPQKKEAVIDYVEYMIRPDVINTFTDNNVSDVTYLRASERGEMNRLQEEALELLIGATSMTKAVYNTISDDCRKYFFESIPDQLTGNINIAYCVSRSLHGLLAEQRSKNPQKSDDIDRASRLLTSPASIDNTGTQLIQMDSMYTYSEMEWDLDRLWNQYNAIYDYGEIGWTLQDRYLYEIVLGNPQASKQILVQSSIHAREYMCTQLTMKMVEYYCRLLRDDAYYKNLSYRDLFNNICIRIVPMANPDGVSIAQFGVSGARRNDTRQWLSGFSNLQQIKANSNGVDLNRNFPTGWDVSEQNSEHYNTINSLEFWKGPFVASEYETQALMNLVKAYPFKVFLNYHSMGNVVYFSSGITNQQCYRKNKIVADIINQETGYELIDTSRVGPNGSFGDFAIEAKQEPSCTIEIGSANPVPQDELFLLYLQNRDVWGEIMYQLYYGL